ncbi:hypothetical protein C9439_06585 [archaeon SCG-AAA382B04]|nr:hypothetical protein C9439_06585 [archaeon SCG-AAA382B04]
MVINKTLIIALLITFLINLPFGYFRYKYKRFGLKWFLAIHLPVPIVAYLRIYSDTPLIWLPVFFLIFFLGQYTGSKINEV